MIFVPLPFVVSLLLLILLVRMTDGNRDEAANGLFVALLSIYAVLSVLIGLRWGYEVRVLLPLQTVLAAAWAPLAWLSFQSLTREGPVLRTGRDWPHAVPALGVVVLFLSWTEPIDLVLIAIYLAYGIALGRLAWSGPDRLKMVRLEGSQSAHRALVLTSIALVAFALIDMPIAIDIRFFAGNRGPLIVAAATIPALLMLGVAAAIAGHGRPPEETLDAHRGSSGPAEPEDIEIVQIVDSLMRSSGLYRDFNLNLNRLARKSGIPARQLSAAVNRVTGRNVSQYVNAFRIEEACRLLRSSPQSITELMLNVGFQTKSNFNLEFRRSTGMTPRQWRARAEDTQTGPSMP